MQKLDCGGVSSLIYFSSGENVAKKHPPIAAEALIQSFAKVAEEKNRELSCYVCTDMNRKLSMLYGAILIIHFKAN